MSTPKEQLKKTSENLRSIASSAEPGRQPSLSATDGGWRISKRTLSGTPLGRVIRADRAGF